VTSRDFPLTQTLVVYIAVIIVVINFLVDIVIQIIDPRIRLADRS
jgi:ABC-type dipeptide/oligopeptide/nickel transport system permease component